MARGGFWLFALFGLLLASCGQDICIGGVGQCGYDPAKFPAKGTGSPTRDGSTGAPGSNGSSSGFTIAISAASVGRKQSVEVRAAGAKGDITWKTTFPSAGFGEVREFRYYAPDTQVTQHVRIQATDSENKVSNEIEIQVTP